VTTNQKHIGAIEESFTDDELQAACSCGWKGEFTPSRHIANDELRKNYQDVAEASK
jgi:hypothetical protein